MTPRQPDRRLVIAAAIGAICVIWIWVAVEAFGRSAP